VSKASRYDILPPYHNIRDFEFLLTTFGHSSYSDFFANIKNEKLRLKYYR
jgi:hypothetical protein